MAFWGDSAPRSIFADTPFICIYMHMIQPHIFVPFEITEAPVEMRVAWPGDDGNRTRHPARSQDGRQAPQTTRPSVPLVWLSDVKSGRFKNPVRYDFNQKSRTFLKLKMFFSDISQILSDLILTKTIQTFLKVEVVPFCVIVINYSLQACYSLVVTDVFTMQ